MREEAYDGDDEADVGPSGFARVRSIVSTAIGAIVAMALLMALGIWFYRLGVRDAQNVPIIRAALEPAKVRPEDPGGMVAPHQGIQSYEAAEAKPASAAAVILAPVAPTPKPDDLALAELAPEPPAPEPPAAPAEAPSAAPQETSAPATQQSAAPTEAPAPAASSAAAVTPEAGPAARPSTTPESSETPAAPEAEEAPLEVAALDQTPVQPEPIDEATGTEFAPRKSPAVPSRPADLMSRTARAADAAQQQQSDLVRKAAASKVQIQLAADPSEAAMKERWRVIRRANEDILRGRELAIQTTVSGGTTYYRLRVGPFENGAEARNVCQALKARGQDCIVARNG